MPTHRSLWPILLALSALAGCAHRIKGPGPEATQMRPSYPERVQARLEQAESQGVHQVRYNPTSCGCPAHEVQVSGVWHRVSLDVDEPDDPVLISLREAEEGERAQGESRTYALQGRLSSDLSTCGRGAIMVHLRPTAFGAPVVDEEPEENDSSGDAPETPAED